MEPGLVAALRGVLGERGVVADPTRLLGYEFDGLAVFRERAELVVLPRTTAEAAAAVRLLHAHGVPLVARGAGTGLTGGATPVAGGAVVSTARMRDVLELDPVDRVARERSSLTTPACTRATRRARWRARSAATSRTTPAARTASATAARRATC